MSEGSKPIFPAPNYTNAGENTKRAYAVSAAIELIAARVASSAAGPSLEYEMSKLSDYADLIQEAISSK